MKLVVVMIAALLLISTTYAQGQHTFNGRKPEPMQTTNDITLVAPALEKYAQGPLADPWKRPGRTPRDRSIVTISALIARNQTIEMPHYFNLALDNGVKPRELPCDGQRADCERPGCADSLPPEPRDGQRGKGIWPTGVEGELHDHFRE